MARLNLKKRKSRRRRKRVYGGGPLTDNWAPPASNTTSRHRDAEMFLYNKQKYLEQRDAKKPSKLRFISYLDYKRNRDIIPESTMRAIQSLMDNPDPKYQQLGYERLEDELKYRDIMANPTEYLKAWKEGKHRESHWRGTLAKTVAGLAATAAAAYSLYNWGIPGLMNPLSGGIKNAFAKDTAQEDLKNQGGTAEDQKKLDETVKQTEKESTAEKAQQMGAEVLGETVIGSMQGNNGGTPGTSVPDTTPATTGEAEVPIADTGAAQETTDGSDLLGSFKSKKKPDFKYKEEEDAISLIDEDGNPRKAYAFEDWENDQSAQPRFVNDVEVPENVYNARDYNDWTQNRIKNGKHWAFGIDPTKDSSIVQIDPRRKIVQVFDKRDGITKNIKFENYHKYAMGTDAAKGYQEDFNRMNRMYIADDTTETGDPIWTRQAKSNRKGNYEYVKGRKDIKGVNKGKRRILDLAAPNEESKRDSKWYKEYYDEVERNQRERKISDLEQKLEDPSVPMSMKKGYRVEIDKLKHPDTKLTVFRDEKGNKVRSKLDVDGKFNSAESKAWRDERNYFLDILDKLKAKDKEREEYYKMNTMDSKQYPLKNRPKRHIDLDASGKKVYERLSKFVQKEVKGRNKRYTIPSDDLSLLSNYLRNYHGSGYHHRRKSGGRLRVTRKGRKLLKKYRRHLKKRSRY